MQNLSAVILSGSNPEGHYQETQKYYSAQQFPSQFVIYQQISCTQRTGPKRNVKIRINLNHQSLGTLQIVRNQVRGRYSREGERIFIFTSSLGRNMELG